jgi:hypothetical protein
MSEVQRFRIKANPKMGAIGYSVPKLGLNNQKLALLGLFTRAAASGKAVVLPALCNYDTALGNHGSIELERAYSIPHLLRFAKAFGVEVVRRDSFEDVDGWGSFCLGAEALGRDIIRGAEMLDGFTCQFFRHLQPVVTASDIFKKLFLEVFVARKLKLVCQLRIEKDWVTHAATLRENSDGFSDDPAPSYAEIFLKIISTLSADAIGRQVYVVCDENSLPVGKETIRNEMAAAFGLTLIWKSDILSAAEMQLLSVLDQSIIDFEMAVRAPAFVGLTRSTFSNAVTAEAFCRRGKLPMNHYIYNQMGPQLGVRHDYGAHVDPGEATNPLYRRTALVADSIGDCVWPAVLTAHLSQRGDFRTGNGAVAGGRRVPLVVGVRGDKGRWIEGFSLEILGGGNGGIEYRGRLAGGEWTGWVGPGGFVGSKGLGQGLTGFAVRLTGQWALSYECVCVGSFSGNTELIQGRHGQECASQDGSPLEAIQLVFRPASGQ